MAKLKPSAPEPIQFELRYVLSPEGRENYVADTGGSPPPFFALDVALPELNRDLRRRGYKVWIRSLPTEEEAEREARGEGPPDDFFSADELYPALDEPTDNPEAVIAAWEAWNSEVDRRVAEEAERKGQHERDERVHREVFRLEMASWIAAHGSDRLKTAFERGYKVATSYVRERAEREFPGFEVDTQAKARWDERANPSEMALALETRTLEHAARVDRVYEVHIAWLIKDLASRVLTGKEKREVVVVTGYLHFYNLLAEVDPDWTPFR